MRFCMLCRIAWIVRIDIVTLPTNNSFPTLSSSALALIYSPNNFLTLFITLSFSGSYGWSLLGISNTLGKASL